MNYIVSYPNQKIIEIHREKVSSKNGTYLNIYKDTVQTAMKLLSNSAFKVYICLVSNTDGYKFYLSPAAIHKETGICADTVRKSLKELEDNGFIKHIEGNRYEFYEKPEWCKYPNDLYN